MSASTEPRAEPFRHAPPVTGTRVLRERLLGPLAGRFERRVTLLRAGPGFGKTTLLRQAIEQNRMDPRGHDAWLACSPADRDETHLLAGILDSLRAPGPPTVASIVDAVWSRSPLPVALILDDLHLVPERSPGALALGTLLETLAERAHLVLSSRVAPPIALARLRAQGQVLELDEDVLAFSEEEATRFAAERGMEKTGGTHWPALLELQAAAGPAAVDAYVWEEVLQQRDDAQRAALARLAHVEWLDDALVEALVGPDWKVARVLDGLPLVARAEHGRGRLHPLWRPHLERLEGAGDPAHRRAAARALRARGRVIEALAHARAAEDADEQEACLRQLAVHDHTEYGASELRDALALVDEATPARTLLLARIRFRSDPVGARELLEKARAAFEAVADHEGEAETLKALGRLAHWAADTSALPALYEHGIRLRDAGFEGAQAMLSLGNAMTALMQGDSQAALAAIDEARMIGDVDEATATMLAGLSALQAGDPARVLDEVGAFDREGAPSAMAGSVKGLRFTARWLLGETTSDALRDRDGSFDADEVESNHNVVLFHATTAFVLAMDGEPERAERHLDALAPVRRHGLGDRVQTMLDYTHAALAIHRGDEAAAAERLAKVHEDGRFDAPVEQHRHRALALPFLLVPDAREGLDALPLGPVYATGRAIGRALALAREGRFDAAAALEWSQAQRLRPQLPLPLRTELWIAANAGGAAIPEAWLPRDARTAMRQIAERDDGPLAGAARSWLETVAAPPREAIEVRVLGPLELRRGGAVVDDDGWRRERVRSLLQLLIARRRLRRDEAAVALWPDKSESASANNLRVNLSHLGRVLEPERLSGEPSWFLRSERDRLELDDHLDLDVDRFERACDEADRASARGVPARALERYEEALPLYRGDYLEDAPELEWGEADRTRLRMRFVRAAVRAGELQLGLGSPEPALERAAMAIQAEPWDEAARRLEARAYLALSDRAAARRAIEAALATLADADLSPEDATAALARQLGIDIDIDIDPAREATR